MKEIKTGKTRIGDVVRGPRGQITVNKTHGHANVEISGFHRHGWRVYRSYK